MKITFDRFAVSFVSFENSSSTCSIHTEVTAVMFQQQYDIPMNYNKLRNACVQLQ